MKELELADALWVQRRLPINIIKLLQQYGRELFLAGGFIRACVAGEKPADIDLFVPSYERAVQFADQLTNSAASKARQLHTKNAITVIGSSRFSVQFVHRWVFTDPKECIKSFDFTIAQAVMWYESSTWNTACSDTFYADLAAHRLLYTTPIRNEDAGGSMLRVLKFYQRGYRIPLTSLGAVIARLVNNINFRCIRDDAAFTPAEKEAQIAKIIASLLFEVDPNAMNTDPAYIADTEEAAAAVSGMHVKRADGTILRGAEAVAVLQDNGDGTQ